MTRFLMIVTGVLLGFSSCTSLKQTTALQPLPCEPPALVTTSESPAQAQISTPEVTLPATEFRAAEVLKSVEKKNVEKTEALASLERKAGSPTWQKPLGLSKMVVKMAEKQVVKAIQKRRPAQRDGTILGMRPVLFFALLAVLIGVILLFVAGKSQFFSILTVTLLIGGLLISLAAFLDLI